MELKNQNEKAINTDLGIFILRLALAAVFIINGAAKLSNIDGTTAFFAQVGLGAFWVYLVALVELVGGIAMFIGMASEWAGILLALDMLGAIYFVKFARGFLGGGYQFELMLFLAALTITFTGAGAYTLMHLVRGAKMKSASSNRPVTI